MAPHDRKKKPPVGDHRRRPFAGGGPAAGPSAPGEIVDGNPGKWGKICGKSWGNLWDIYGNLWDIYGNLWEIYGTSMGHLWEIYGILWGESYGNPPQSIRNMLKMPNFYVYGTRIMVYNYYVYISGTLFNEIVLLIQ